MKWLFVTTVLVASLLGAPSRADSDDGMLAADALTSLGLATACGLRIKSPDAQTKSLSLFKETIAEYDREFRRVYGVTLTEISNNMFHVPPATYVREGDKALARNFSTQEALKDFCASQFDKITSIVTVLHLKGKH